MRCLNEGKQLLLGLSETGGVIGDQPVFHHAQVFADVRLVERHIAQHAQVGIGALQQVLEPFEHRVWPSSELTSTSAALMISVALPSNPFGAHLQVVQTLGVLEALGIQNALDGLLRVLLFWRMYFSVRLYIVRSCMKRTSAGNTTRSSSRPMLCMRCKGDVVEVVRKRRDDVMASSCSRLSARSSILRV